MTRWLLALTCALVLPAIAHAHLLPKQNATINLVDRSAFLVVSVPASALADVDDDRNGLLSPGEIQRHDAGIREQFERRLRVSSDGEPGEAAMTWVLPPQTEGPAIDSDYVIVMHRVDFAAAPGTPRLETDLFGTANGEAQMMITATQGARSEVALLEPGAPSHVFFRSGAAAFWHFVRVGCDHILSGTDHLLFLLTVLVAVSSWRYWLGVVTSFTLAHSLTLSLAALGFVRVSPQLIEPAIAASIVAMAALNLWDLRPGAPGAAPGRIAIVFACGLLHGLGFASAIGPAILDPGRRLVTLAGFNVGVEIGQALFLGAALGVAWLLRRLRRDGVAAVLPRFASAVAAVAGIGMLLQRTYPAIGSAITPLIGGAS